MEKYYNMPRDFNKACSLECKDGGDAKETIHEFVGPVRIVFVDPRRADYWHKTCAPAIMTLAYLLLVVCVVTIIYWTITFKLPMTTNVHVAACMIGFHLLMPTGILMLDPMFGGGMELRPNNKRLQHLFLEFVTVCYLTAGIFHLSAYKSLTSSIHSIIGLAALASVGLSVLLGLFAYFPSLNKCGLKHPAMTLIHKISGMTSLILSLLVFCTGVFTPAFKDWCYDARLIELPFVMIVFGIIYTFCIVFSVYWRLHYSYTML